MTCFVVECDFFLRFDDFLRLLVLAVMDILEWLVSLLSVTVTGWMISSS
jgi:hypothetical protein